MNRSILLTSMVALATVALAAKHDFATTDADTDGKVSPKEYATLVQMRFAKSGKVGYEKAAEKQFKKKDTNADGVLSEEEFSIKPRKK